MLGEQGAYCRADDRLTLPEESIAESCLTLWGVEATWSHSSVEPTRYLVDRATIQLGHFLFPLFMLLPVIHLLFRM